MSPREFYKGSSAHIYKNLFVLLGGMSTLGLKREELRVVFNVGLSMFIGYPWLTVIRRLHAQSKLPGMIPVRYGSAWHCFTLIAQEEGLRGLYRGFIAYAIAVILLLSFNRTHLSAISCYSI